MKEQLINLSKKVGFISVDNLIKVNDSYYYLWMCELQKWLMESHNIYAIPDSTFTMALKTNIGFYSNVFTPNLNSSTVCFKTIYYSESFYYHFEEALEEGLYKACEFLKNNI